MSDNEKSVCGYRNLGNTCYMNAPLQALVATPGLSELFQAQCDPSQNHDSLSQTFSAHLRERRRLCERAPRNAAMSLADSGAGGRKRSPSRISIKSTHTQKVECCPMELVKNCKAKMEQFDGFEQQDASEFLRCLLAVMHEELLTRNMGQV